MRSVEPLTHRLPQAEPPLPRRRYDDLAGVAIHHSGNARSTPWTMARYHTLPEDEDGRGWPTIGYAFAIGGGRIYQTASVETFTHHAGAYNGSRLGICFLGDYDVAAPAEEDLWCAADLVSLILIWRELRDPFAMSADTARVVEGHGALGRDATAKTNGPKTCPGELFPIGGFRTLVGQVITARQDLDAHGAELAMRAVGIDI